MESESSAFSTAVTHLRFNVLHSLSIPSWNDEFGRTKHDVIKALNKAIKTIGDK